MYAVLRLKHEIVPNFSTELWSLIDVKISIFLNIFRNNEWILIKFCLRIDIYDPCCDLYTLFSQTFQQRSDPQSLIIPSKSLKTLHLNEPLSFYYSYKLSQEKESLVLFPTKLTKTSVLVDVLVDVPIDVIRNVSSMSCPYQLNVLPLE